MYDDSIFGDMMDALMKGSINNPYKDNADEDVFYDVVKNGYRWKTKDGRIIPLEKIDKDHWRNIVARFWLVESEYLIKCEEYLKKHNPAFK